MFSFYYLGFCSHCDTPSFSKFVPSYFHKRINRYYLKSFHDQKIWGEMWELNHETQSLTTEVLYAFNVLWGFPIRCHIFHVMSQTYLTIMPSHLYRQRRYSIRVPWHTFQGSLIQAISAFKSVFFFGMPGWLSGWESAFCLGRDPSPGIKSHIRVPARSLLLPLPVSLPLSVCLSWVNKLS